MVRYLRCLYRQAASPWGVAAGGCKPAVKKLPLKGTREVRRRRPISGAWLSGPMVSLNEAGFDPRER